MIDLMKKATDFSFKGTRVVSGFSGLRGVYGTLLLSAADTRSIALSMV